jgi:NAD(P)-dependent dehydrogenase (short-subunit alcohol dehydrogenase family)
MARVAIVTGGTRGIGKAISIALRDQDYRGVAIYRSNTSAAHVPQRHRQWRPIHELRGLV